MRRVRRCAPECQMCIYQCVHLLCTSGAGGWVRSTAVRGDVCVTGVFSVPCTGTGTEVTHQLTEPRFKNGLDLVSQVLPSDILLKNNNNTKRALQLCLTERSAYELCPCSSYYLPSNKWDEPVSDKLGRKILLN